MCQKQISPSALLGLLKEKGIIAKWVNNYLVIANVPYVNKEKIIKNGVLIDTKVHSNMPLNNGNGHIMHFSGEFPCNIEGKELEGIRLGVEKIKICEGLITDFTFSTKVRGVGYNNYVDKIVNYYRIISSQANALGSIEKHDFEYVEDKHITSLQYEDMNSSRANIRHVSKKLYNQKIAIVGVGGTGSFILDHLSKCDVSSIHIIDDDILKIHNAFRIPGAVKESVFSENILKVNYLQNVYNVINKNIKILPEKISEINVNILDDMDMIFVCIDGGKLKEYLINYLIEKGLKFIDTGIGIECVDSKLIGSIVNVYADEKYNSHVIKHITLNSDGFNEYNSNIQISEINALAASLAVIKWKQSIGFYADYYDKNTLKFNIEIGDMINDKKI